MSSNAIPWQRDPWPKYSYPLDVRDLTVPWNNGRPDESPARSSARSGATETTLVDKGTLLQSPGRVRRGLKRLFSSRRKAAKDAPPYPEKPQIPTPDPDILPLDEWRQYAAWTRPMVNGVLVHNSDTPSPTPYRDIPLERVNIQEVFESLRSPNGTHHPENWIPGLRHVSLPRSKPPGWELPAPGAPQAFPWECTLNPLLVHSPAGAAPLHWDIQRAPNYPLYGGPCTDAIPIFEQDLWMPATRPLVTHMHITGLALTDVRFPWKFMVINAAGVRLGDVLKGVVQNFSQHVYAWEFDRWTEGRRERALVEYYLRKGNESGDGIRRMDYLGGHVLFRGIAPNPDRTGWVLFMGTQW